MRRQKNFTKSVEPSKDTEKDLKADPTIDKEIEKKVETKVEGKGKRKGEGKGEGKGKEERKRQAPWMPLVYEILGFDAELRHIGCMISEPGSTKQVFSFYSLFINPFINYFFCIL